ncbi:dihydrofolate reductase family protein [Nocardioides sp. R-C-SC26]|uniref:dihydrofolate reductase family protein n=1 Tax=Nocardioides sp. R-C-SC26 TaxID=2870414 RepID=UPI001E574271|nr:dihydrofolate reductase family protein [Nocardioides sp. R-C-SC26]
MTSRYRYYTAATLDGFLADEHHDLGWLFAAQQERGAGHDYDAFIAGVGAVVMGASTSTWVVDHLDHPDIGGAWPYEQPAFVFTHRDLPRVAEQIRFVEGPVAGHRGAIEAAAGSRDVWVMGGGGLASDFADAGMLDDVLITVAPVALGSGQPLFSRPVDLQLTWTARDGDFVAASYDVLGPRKNRSDAAEGEG